MNDRIRALPAAPTWRPSRPSLACLAAGIMFASAMPPLRGTAVLAPLAIAIVFHVLRAAPRPGRLGFYFGFGYAGPLMSWLFFLDPAKSIPSRALVPLQALGAILWVAGHYWLFGLLVGRLRARLGSRLILALLPVLWLLLELVRSVGEMGFPWCLTGAAWLETPLRPLYAACGEIGLGAATALTAAALVAVVDLVRRRPGASAHRRGLVVATVLMWLGLAVLSRPTGVVVDDEQRTGLLPVACVQADVAQKDKWVDAKIDSTKIPYTELTRRAAAGGAELVVWAETAVPAYIRYNRSLLDWVRGLAQEDGTAIIAGFPDARLIPGQEDEQGRRKYLKYNSAGLFSPQGTLIDTYGKHHLVPIGEAMPLQRLIPALGRIDVGQAEWTHGEPPGPMILPTVRGEVRPFTLICYEAVFSDLARQAVRRGGAILVNITNDGWFGHPSGPGQHAALSRIRAVECGVPLVRCANNGISMICGPDGAVRARLGLHERGMIAAEVETVPRGTWYVRAGIWPAVGFLLLWIPVAVVLVRRDRACDPEEA